MTSKIKVDNINKVSDDSNIINKCGTAINVGASGNTVTVTGNDIRSDSYKAADGGVIASQSGTTITLGASGDTIQLASGASQSGFGRTGTVDWQTGSIKTGTFTAANGEGYFADTNAGGFTMNLPAGVAGYIVSVVDYTNTFQNNALVVTPNGSDKIGGVNANAVLATKGQSVTFVYVDGTEGWKNIQDSTSNVIGSNFVSGSGGDSTITCGDYKTHIFTGPGTFCVSSAGSACGSNSVEYLVVAGGGGGGGGSGSAGGGAGGYRQNYPSPATGGTPVSTTAYPITVGGAGAADPAAPYHPSADSSGADSIFSTITSTGGGGGGSESPCAAVSAGANGGSGGGGSFGPSPSTGGGTGNTPVVSPPQGNNGGSGGGMYGGGGGGGHSAVGANSPSGSGGNGGDGTPIADAFIGPTAPSYGTSGPAPGRFFAGGGGGGGQSPGSTYGTGGAGGGGSGGYYPSGAAPVAGTTNTGGGGGGGKAAPGSNGGSGIVIIRYKFQ